MKISHLGHSEFLLELSPPGKGPVRVLFDTWLSNFAFGDFLARSPRLSLDFALLPRIDYIYLTHTHCDHFDPYTLVELYKHQNPVILLPETIQFTRTILERFLNVNNIVVMRHGETRSLSGLRMTAYHFARNMSGNEDDVMPVSLQCGSDTIFYEADTDIPAQNETADLLFDLFVPAKNRYYIATRNELQGFFLSLDNSDPKKRKEQLAAYKRMRRLEIDRDFSPPTSERMSQLWKLPNMQRLLVGQGFVLPPEFAEEGLALCSPYPTGEVASDENRTRQKLGHTGKTIALEGGVTYDLEGLQMREASPLDGISAITRYRRTWRADATLRRKNQKRPLRNNQRNTDEQRILIHRLLNERFLPYALATATDPLFRIVQMKTHRQYSIRFLFGTAENSQTVDWAYTLEKGRFEVLDRPAEQTEEVYWANDIEDHLNGTQDMFSTTLHHFMGKKLRLWNFLGMPFLNQDVVTNKLTFHFEKAIQGSTVDEFVLPLYQENW